MFNAPDPKSPLFDMVRGIVNAQAALVRGLPAEPAVTRIEFAPGHEDARLTSEQVAALMRKVRLAPRMLEELKVFALLMRSPPSAIRTRALEECASAARAIIAEADCRSPQEPA